MHGHHQARDGQPPQQDQRRQHAWLAEPVEVAALHDRRGRVGDRRGRRQCAGERVGTGLRNDEQHDAQRLHRERQTGHQAGGAEEQRARHGQDPSVGCEHRGRI